jgi:GntR family transcriptional regulator/MocR family aminotransferase
VPVGVDAQGLNVADGIACCPDARLAYVTPAYQFPQGVTMSLARRLELLQWANRAGAWILEDDYDNEFQYAGRPLSALQRLDPYGRVLYLGTFSKVLFPALRLGYLVVPPDLVDAFLAARAATDRQAPLVEQVIMTDFMTQGHFARHIRTSRAIYGERQSILLASAAQYLAGRLGLQPSEGGMHLVGALPAEEDDGLASARALRAGVIVPPISAYSLRPLKQPALLLGYTTVGAQEISEGIRKLATALQSLGR